jgi:hypothetical protein
LPIRPKIWDRNCAGPAAASRDRNSLILTGEAQSQGVIGTFILAVGLIPDRSGTPLIARVLALERFSERINLYTIPKVNRLI